MTSKERLLTVLEGRPADRVPLTTWCFGFPAPKHLRWTKNGRDVRYWYSMRMEHLHTLAEPWDLDDDFRRVLAWFAAGIDDVLDVSVPWSVDPQVTFTDSTAPADTLDALPVLIRDYQTPSGPLRHAVRQTGEETAPGWVIQPPHVCLFEDYNIPRAVKHAVASPADLGPVAHLYRAPDEKARRAFAERMAAVKTFADRHGVLVQAWSTFGMDAVVWLAGTEGAVLLAMDEPDAFDRLVHLVAETDYARTELALTTPGADLVIQRGWYSSTDFWSPALFDRHVFPHVKRLADLAHRHNKKLGYVMTTGVEALGPRLADAGVDVLYFVDPVQDRFRVARARELLGGRMTLVGGTNALSLAASPERIRAEVRDALDALAPTNRFILHPLDAIFPDTPWSGVETLIDAWKGYHCHAH